MIPVLAVVVVITRMVDSWGINNGWNFNFAILLVMLVALTNIIMSLRVMFFLPQEKTAPQSARSTKKRLLCAWSDGILSDFMVFLVPGFLSGQASTWWYASFMNWTVVFHGHNGLMLTHVLTSLIMGIISLYMVGLAAGGIYHFVQVRKKKRSFGVVGIFNLLPVHVGAHPHPVRGQRDGFRPFQNMSGRPFEAGVYWDGAIVITEEQEARAVLIDALTRGFTEHLVYPIIALLHAVKFGLIRIETDLEKKALRGLALVLLLAMAAVFTEVLQEVLNMVGLPNNDIIFAIICGPVLATGWEKLLIEAMLPEKETLGITWTFPGNDSVLLWTVNLIVGGAFLLQFVIGVFSPMTFAVMFGVFIASVVAIVVVREIPGGCSHERGSAPADEQERGPPRPRSSDRQATCAKAKGRFRGPTSTSSTKEEGHREIKELPPLTFLIGGDEARWFVPAVLVGALLMSAWGASSIGSANTPMFRMISMEHQGNSTIASWCTTSTVTGIQHHTTPHIRTTSHVQESMARIELLRT